VLSPLQPARHFLKEACRAIPPASPTGPGPFRGTAPRVRVPQASTSGCSSLTAQSSDGYEVALCTPETKYVRAKRRAALSPLPLRRGRVHPEGPRPE